MFRGRVQRVRSTGRGRREDARQWEKRQWWRYTAFAEEVFSGGRFGWSEEDFRGEGEGVCDFEEHGVRHRLG